MEPDLTIDTLVLGPLETNTYVVRCEKDCWVIDPASMDGGRLVRFLQEIAASPSRVLLTHGHADHIAGAGELRKAFGSCRLGCPQADAAMLTDPAANMSAAFGVPFVVGPADDVFAPGHVLACGETQWAVLDTSGHTPGGVSFYCRQAKVVFTGDALFAGSIGRTDIPGGSVGRLIKNIRLSLMSLDGDTRVLSGHGPESTIGQERRLNPFLKDFYKTKSR